MGKKKTQNFDIMLQYAREHGLSAMAKKTEELGKGQDLEEFFKWEKVKSLIVGHMVEKEGFEEEASDEFSILARKGKVKRRVEVRGWPETGTAGELFGGALLEIVYARGKDKNLEIALGLPKVGIYMDLLEKTDWARKKLRFHCYLVDAGGEVSVVSPDEPLPSD